MLYIAWMAHHALGRRRCSVAGLSALVAWVVAARASVAVAAPTAPLADRIPAAAVAYAGWPGTGSLKDFNDTHLARLVAGSDLSGWLDGVMSKDHPGAAGTPVFEDIRGLVHALAGYAWGNPSAAYSLGKGVDENLATRPHLCFLIDFGTAAAAANAEQDIQSRLDRIVQGNPIPNVRLFKSGSILALDLHSAGETNPLEVPKAPLSEDARFVRCLGKSDASASPAAVVYANLESVWPILEEVNESNAEFSRHIWILGAKGATGLMVCARPDGADWRSHVFVEIAKESTTRPAAGIIGALATTRPATGDLYAGVPASAVQVTTFSLDPARLIATAKAEIDPLRPGTGAQIDAWAGIASGVLGVDLKAFLQDLGPEVAVISLPRASDPQAFEFVAMLTPTSTERTESQLTRIVDGVQRFLTAQRPDAPQPSLATNGAVSTLAVGPVEVSWTAVGGHLYVARSAATINTVIAELGKGKLSDTAEFHKLLGRLAPPPGATLSYANTPLAIPGVLAAWQEEAGSPHSKIKPELLNLPVPPPDLLLKESGPSLTATWLDSDGLNYAVIAPHPGAELLNPLVTLFVGPEPLSALFRKQP